MVAVLTDVGELVAGDQEPVAVGIGAVVVAVGPDRVLPERADELVAADRRVRDVGGLGRPHVDAHVAPADPVAQDVHLRRARLDHDVVGDLEAGERDTPARELGPIDGGASGLLRAQRDALRSPGRELETLVAAVGEADHLAARDPADGGLGRAGAGDGLVARVGRLRRLRCPGSGERPEQRERERANDRDRDVGDPDPAGAGGPIGRDLRRAGGHLIRPTPLGVRFVLGPTAGARIAPRRSFLIHVRHRRAGPAHRQRRRP